MSVAGLITRGFGVGCRPSTILKRGLANYTGLPEPPPSGQAYTDCSSTSYVGYSLQQGSSPAVVVGDTFMVDTKTVPTLYPVVVFGDGTVSVNTLGDTSRQYFNYSIYRIGSNTVDGPATSWVNEAAPVWSGVIFLNNQVVGSFAPINLNSYVSSPSGDTLTFSLASGTLPSGLFLFSNGVLSGTLTAGGTFSFTVNATDLSGTSTASSVHQIIVTTNITSAAVPSVTGLQVDAAIASVRAAGFYVVQLIYVDTNYNGTQTVANIVLNQNPAAGASALLNSTVSLVVSTGTAYYPGSVGRYRLKTKTYQS